jgi:hypothetical protein
VTHDEGGTSPVYDRPQPPAERTHLSPISLPQEFSAFDFETVRFLFTAPLRTLLNLNWEDSTKTTKTTRQLFSV